MEQYRRDFFIARIRAGYVPVQFEGKRFTVHHPNADEALIVQEKCVEAHEWAENEGLLTDDEVLHFIIQQGIWNDTREDEYQRIAPGHIEHWKIELYNAALKSNTRERTRKYLQAAKDEYARLGSIRHAYDYTTVQGFTNQAEKLNTIALCTRLDGEPVDWREYNLANIANLYYRAMMNQEQIRELARTPPWTNLWGVLKANKYIFGEGSLTVEQQSLLSWSVMYDRIHESPDCPTEEVMQDDDMLDGWLLIQKRKRETEQKQKEVESVLNPKLKNAGEIGIVVETKADAEKVEILNTAQAKNIKQQRMKLLKEKGMVREAEFSDVKQKRAMEMNKAYIQKMKGSD